MNRQFPFVVLFLILSGSTESLAVSVSGRVTNKNQEPLSFANAYIKGSTKGTTTNIDGFYKLEVPEGRHEIIFRFMGYKMMVVPVTVTREPLVLNMEMEQENYTLTEVKIQADAEDPAYPIIRKAISMRKFYLEQVDEYSCDVYIKGLQRITKYPAKVLGVEVNLSEFIDSTTGIVYLSESVSKYHYKKPDDVKEVMISSKVSGSNRAFSFNQASDMNFNFYENIIMAGGLSQRGFISPISTSALFYYRYRLDGSFLENGKWINRIEVIPKRKNDPVFSGYIFIQDSTWRIHSTDLYLTRDAQIEFVDTLQINQAFIPVSDKDDVWMLGSVAFYFVFSGFGFEGNGNYIGVHSGYEINPEFEKRFFKGNVMKITDDANKKDSSYWESIRPVPLTLEESNDYLKRDSMQIIKESKHYMDSLDRLSNKFKAGNLLAGYTYRDRYSKTEISFSSLLETIQFNTVEGLNTGIGASIEKGFEDRRSLHTNLRVRYGFSNEKVSGSAAVRYNYNVKKFAYIRLEGGDNLVQFNEAEPISPLINTSYSLFDEKNYLKLFRKQYGKVSYRLEPINGLRLMANAEYAVRSAQVNTTDYSFRNSDVTRYTSNNPLDPSIDSEFFPTNEAFTVSLTARVRIKQKYVDRPDMNYILGSKYPTFFVDYSKGVHAFIGSDVDYDMIAAGVEDKLRLGMLGTIYYYGAYGRFLNTKKLYFMDLIHFKGNQTYFSSFEPNRFDLLEYYKYSTSDEYVQLFAEHEFGGFILNKIPLLRKLKLNEIAGIRLLHIPGVINHYETSFGLEKLGIIRADFVMSFDDKGKTRTGFVIGVKTRILQ